MKALGEAAVDLPGLSPAAQSLAALAGGNDAWSSLRNDPAALIVLVQHAPEFPPDFLAHALTYPSALLARVLSQLEDETPAWIDWGRPDNRYLLQVCRRQARLAQELASRVQGCHPAKAWIGGMLAPLGWLALASIDPAQSVLCRDADGFPKHASAWQQQHWGLDHTAVVRRLVRVWRLPDWLGRTLSHISLPVEIAERLGVEPVFFKVVQLAVALSQQHDGGLGLPLGAGVAELLTALGVSAQFVDDTCRQLFAEEADSIEVQLEDPRRHPHLAQLLRLALENGRLREAAASEPWQREVDLLQRALEDQCAGEMERLRAQKLSALAEVAAGAGHEINNPLAVISGQAQYALKHLQALEIAFGTGTLLPPGDTEQFAQIKNMIGSSLHTIVHQAQRIHNILLDLMQFARPTTPKLQAVDVRGLVEGTAQSLQRVAEERKVRLETQAPLATWTIQGDPAQLHIALNALLRNALEAAPAEGWAGVRVVERAAAVELLVEDNGPGLAPGVQEHLFDPFYSGRSAGRGRGLGLPTAWRLARLHGGDVRFEGCFQGLTRFVLSLPADKLVVPDANGHAFNGSHGAALARTTPLSLP